MVDNLCFMEKYMYLVTGGAGFFGEIILKELLLRGNKVRSFDLNSPNLIHPNLDVVKGDVRDKKIVDSIFENINVVHHNIAQVPLAKNKELFWSVNYDGTENLLKSALRNKVNHFVYTSSSAVYGVPVNNPVNDSSETVPAEEYGKAKLAGEKLCREYRSKGLNCSVIRPRTILGKGRLGIFQILFEWIYLGLNVPVFDGGDNIYQFIHARDLANACISAGEKSNGDIYNIGTTNYASIKDAIQYVIDSSGSGSKIKSVSSKHITWLMNATSIIGLSPLGSYHALMYGKNFYFDTSRAEKQLNFSATYSNNEMFLESYKWYCENRDDILSKNHHKSIHQSAIKQRILRLVPYLI
tara:strand:- start:404 stop:1465 length:1062 start_codon:yes stop_codon:yes gene_type:complete